MPIVKEIILLSSICRQYAETVDRDIAKTETDPRKGVFWNLSNRVKITEEILTFYEKVCGSDALESEAENSERVLIVTKDMFSDAVSIIEKSMKDMIRLYPKFGLKEATLEKGSHLYLRNVLESAKNVGLMTETEFSEWETILMVRNLAQHNNCIADRNGTVDIANISISMRAGRMMKGPINTFVKLTECAVSKYYTLLMAFENNVKV